MDTVSGIAYGNISITPADALPRQQLETLLQFLSASLIDQPLIIRPTATMPAIIVAAMIGGEAQTPMLPQWPGYPELVGKLTFDITRAGEIVNARSGFATDTALSRRLVNALMTVKAPALQGGAEKASATLTLSVDPDSDLAATQPLLEVHQAKARDSTDAQARLSKAHPVGPRFPSGEVWSRKSALVVAWVNLDAKGKPDMHTFGAAEPRGTDHEGYDAFVDAVKNFLRSNAFESRSGTGCVAGNRLVFATGFGVGPMWPTRIQIRVP